MRLAWLLVVLPDPRCAKCAQTKVLRVALKPVFFSAA
jgi:hypothetical protein